MSLPKDIIGPQKEVNRWHPIRRARANRVREIVSEIPKPAVDAGDIEIQIFVPEIPAQARIAHLTTPTETMAEETIQTPLGISTRAQVTTEGREDFVLVRNSLFGGAGDHVIDYNGGYDNRKNGGRTTIATTVYQQS